MEHVIPTRLHGGEIYDKDVRLDYSVNVNPLGLPEAVKRALTEDLAYAERYPDMACRLLREALADHYGLPSGWFLCGNGASELFQLICAAIRPKSALIEAPTFYGYEHALRTVGAAIRRHCLKKENGFALTEAILDEIDDDCGCLFLCQPNNPVGLTIDRALLKAVADRCRKTKTYLVVDECFLEFVPGCEELTAREWLKDNPYLIVVSAFTKVYAMPGIRLGFLMTSDGDLLERMKACQVEWSVSGAAQAAGVAALTQEAYVEAARKLIPKERQYLTDQLTSLGFTVYPSEANYLLIETDGPDLAEKLLKRGILIRRCANFAGLDERFYRIAVRGHNENISFIETLKDALKE